MSLSSAPSGDPHGDLRALGRRLEAARHAAGLSAREASALSGISPAYLRALERGENPKTGKPSRPSPDALLLLARNLNCEISEVFPLAGYDPELAYAYAPGTATSRRTVDAFLRQLQQSAKSLTHRTPFMYARTVERLEDFVADFAAACGGTLRCSSEDEPHLTRQALTECRSHLRAVSYQDEPWWETDAGDIYLELHADLRQQRPDVEMTRIFLIDAATLPKVKHVLDKHADLEIHTYVLTVDQVSPYQLRDYVLYDDVLLRTGSSLPTTDRKVAEFTDDPRRVGQYLEDFKALHQLAVISRADAESVLARSLGPHVQEAAP